MAQLDITELLSDPTFVDPIMLIRRTTSVNPFGENILVESSVSTIGSVQPATGKTIQRLPEALRVADVSEFYVKGTITADGMSRYPDLLVFRGLRYQIQTVNDYTNWGAGWCLGTCVIEKPSQE